MDQVDEFLGHLPEHRAAIMKPVLDAWPDVICARVVTAVEKVWEYKKEGKRVLVYVLDDSHASYMNEVMVAKGLDSDYISRFESLYDRDDALRRFNDPNQPADVFITTFKDLEEKPCFLGACQRGIIFEYPSSLAQLRKAIRSIRREGQPPSNDWINFHEVGSMDELKAQGMYIRAAKGILSKADYCPYLEGDLRAIRAYYDLARSMGDSSSRYPRNRVLLDKLETWEIRLEGIFYYAIGEWLVKNPGTANMFKTDTMAKIAKS
ncbi:hypothetical protein ACHAPU_009718 [Fusarium lateritium]